MTSIIQKNDSIVPVNNSKSDDIPDLFLSLSVSNNNSSEINPNELPPNFFMVSLAEIKKKISGYHEFYSEYVNNIYTHMSSNKDLRNLTIFLITVIGIVGVFIFKGFL